MYLRHFGLTHPPLGKATTGELWDDGPLARLKERFLWLLEAPGIGLLTGEPGTGKTAMLRHLALALNPHRYQVVYLAETDFSRTDLYRGLAVALGLEPAYRRAGVMKILNSHKQKLMLFLFFSLRQNTLCFSCSAGFPPAHPCTSPLPSSQAWQPMPL